MDDQKPLPSIAHDDLIAHLQDPESDLDHYLGYMIEITIPGQMAPELVPNPSLVTGIPARTEGGVGMGLANWFMRRRRHRAYRNLIRDGWSGPRIVSEGDSWFQYPTSLQDIIDHLMKDHAILSMGAAGDRLIDIEAQREILLNVEAERASAVLLSAGGNDLFEDGRIADLIEDPFPGAQVEDLVGETFDVFLEDMAGRYLALFNRIHTAFPRVHILIHGYGPAFPKGGSWIEIPLTGVGVPPATQHDIIVRLVERFNAMLSDIAALPELGGMVAHINIMDIGTDRGDWHDEIHLNGPNAARVADRFRDELTRRLDTPVVESGIAPRRARDGLQEAVARQATTLSAFDEPTLLREIDLRVTLLELDPTAAGEAEMPPLVVGRPAPEIGIASIRRATRRLLDRWMTDLREVLCDREKPDNPAEELIVDALGQSKAALSAAVAAWLVSGPFSVPALLAGSLGAWLAGEAMELGRDAICLDWVSERPATPALMTRVTESAGGSTIGKLREKFRTAAGEIDLSEDRIRDSMEQLGEVLDRQVVAPPHVPVGPEGAEAFRFKAQEVLKKLGGGSEDQSVGSGIVATTEAIVVADGTRPAFYVENGFIDLADGKPDRGGWRDDILAHEASLRQVIAASGRIIRGSDRSANNVYGSAWMLEDGRVATARHVLEGMQHNRRSGRDFNSVYFVDFAVEANRPIDPEKVFRIEGLDWASPDIINGTVDAKQLDAAVLRLLPDDDRPFPDPVSLADASQKSLVATNKRFFNIGHPGQPFGTWLVAEEDGNPDTLSRAVLFNLIGDKFGVKRLSPGFVDLEPGLPDNDAKAHVFTHDATTLGGSSGSVLVSAEAEGGLATGLHFAGKFGTENYAHSVPAIRENLVAQDAVSPNPATS